MVSSSVGFLHGNGLESALQGRILLDVLPVLLHSSGSDDLKLAPLSFRGLAASMAPSAPPAPLDHSSSIRHISPAPHLVHDIFNALLELTPVLVPATMPAPPPGQAVFHVPNPARSLPLFSVVSPSTMARLCPYTRLADQTGSSFVCGSGLQNPDGGFPPRRTQGSSLCS